MIDATILVLAGTDCGIPALTKRGLGETTFDDDAYFVRPIRKVFSRVLTYDLLNLYAHMGAGKANEGLLDLIRSERPKYLLYPSRLYEVLESTIQAVRKEGTLVVGWFFDDEMRFDQYSRWWAPYLDYALTNDPEAVAKYEALGVPAMHFVMRTNPELFHRVSAPLAYDVTFVGRKFGDRGDWVDGLRAHGINAQAFGSGWNNGYVSNEEMVRIFNQSRINLSFTQSCGNDTRPQMKVRIFEVCMSGGFLLCEYVPGIEQHFDLDREIVCFRDLEQATAKIRYYLAHEPERQRIADAGLQRAQQDHTQHAALSRAFQTIDATLSNRPAPSDNTRGVAKRPAQLASFTAAYHINWATGLMAAGFPDERWDEELRLAVHYDPPSHEAKILRRIARLPAGARIWLLRVRDGFHRVKVKVRHAAAGVGILRRAYRFLRDQGTASRRVASA